MYRSLSKLDAPLLEVKKRLKSTSNDVATLYILGELVKFFIKQEDWENAINEIDRLPVMFGSEADKEKVQFEIIATIAHSNRMPSKNSIETKVRSRFEKFMKEILAPQKSQEPASNQETSSTARAKADKQETKWQRHLSSEDIYDALKKIGAYNKATTWGIKSFELPRGERSPVEGLPPETVIQRFKNGDIKFQVGNIEVETKGGKKFVRIEDKETCHDFKVNLENLTVSGDAKYISHIVDNNKILYYDVSDDVSKSSYGVKVFFDGERSRLEINIQGISTTISLNL